MLLFFIVDMTVRCITDDTYFVCTLCKKGDRAANASTSIPRSSDDNSDGMGSTFGIGSFLFWCDLISTVSILYDLSLINKMRYNTITKIFMIENGSLEVLAYKANNHYTFRRLAINTLECNLLFVIMRTARCARFVQSRAVVGTSNKINWFRLCKLLQRLNPCFYYYLWKMKRQELLSVTEKGEENLVPACRKQQSINNTQIISVLAAVHAEAEKEAREERERENIFRSGIWDKITTFVLGKDNKLAIQNEAATKIQRAWRNHVRFEFDGEWGDIADPTQIATSIRSNRGNLPDKVKKRSTLASFTASGKFSGEFAPKSRFQSRVGKGRESQVGSDMRIATGQRVAFATLLVLVCTVLFTYTENSLTRARTMVVLHTLTKNQSYRDLALGAAINSSVPMLYEYQPANGTKLEFPNTSFNISLLRPRDIMNITIKVNSEISFGLFNNSKSVNEGAIVEIVATFFIIIFWFAGVLLFSGPITMLVIAPVDQMLQLLGMLSSDPLGYQSTPQYKRFLRDEDAISNHTRWSRETLKGMETSFLKSTILRIGSLMKVGFGSAGVEIIQNNLEKGQKKNMLILNSQGSTVSCIFLFCDIRQFTDATEQLQEEVFVFTNRIAAVVHSICNSFGGAANKNIGDAFLVSWPLDDKGSNKSSSGPLTARSNQADKALLSVIKICLFLTYDNFFLEPLSDAARDRLKTKLKDRAGSVVQIGFGLHAGKAVQGAIGSQRKIDATYVSESVERSEFLESSTKKYGLKVLMSGDFHRLLHSNTRRRCRKVDKVLLLDNDDEYYEDNNELLGDMMELFTFDMDVDAMHRPYPNRNIINNDENENNSDGPTRTTRLNKRRSQTLRNRRKFLPRATKSGRDILVGREELNHITNSSSPDVEFNNGLNSNPVIPSYDYYKTHILEKERERERERELVLETAGPVLPTGPALYSHNVWQSPDMKKIREKHVQNSFFQKYSSGLQKYYTKDWCEAKSCFEAILEHFDDGPSKYFMTQMEQNNGVPPKGFREYGIAEK